MTSEDVYDIIIIEIKNNFEISNSHGVDLKKSLITPTRQKYLSALDNSKSFELWTVLEELEDGNGYKIFYDESENAFGLGVKSHKDELLFLGFYGAFLEALTAM